MRKVLRVSGDSALVAEALADSLMPSASTLAGVIAAGAPSVVASATPGTMHSMAVVCVLLVVCSVSSLRSVLHTGYCTLTSTDSVHLLFTTTTYRLLPTTYPQFPHIYYPPPSTYYSVPTSSLGAPAGVDLAPPAAFIAWRAANVSSAGLKLDIRLLPLTDLNFLYASSAPITIPQPPAPQQFVTFHQAANRTTAESTATRQPSPLPPPSVPPSLSNPNALATDMARY